MTAALAIAIAAASAAATPPSRGLRAHAPTAHRARDRRAGAHSARSHRRRQRARDAHRRTHAVRVDDHATLHLVKYAGSILIEEGSATGSLPGHARVRLRITSKVSARFTIRTRRGTIAGRGGAKLKSSARYASFGGWLSVAHGRGRYAGAHGNGRLYGVINRRTHALTVTTVGVLRY